MKSFIVEEEVEINGVKIKSARMYRHNNRKFYVGMVDGRDVVTNGFLTDVYDGKEFVSLVSGRKAKKDNIKLLTGFIEKYRRGE